MITSCFSLRHMEHKLITPLPWIWVLIIYLTEDTFQELRTKDIVKQDLGLRVLHWLPQFSSVQSLRRVRLFVTPGITARQASLSITNSWSSLRLTSIESVMSSNHLILCHPPFLPPSIFPSIRVFSYESVLRIRRPKCWSFSFNISPSS